MIIYDKIITLFFKEIMKTIILYPHIPCYNVIITKFSAKETTMKKSYVYFITLSHMINDSCQSILPALLPLFIYTYGLTLEQAGLLILANTALSSLLQPLLGYVSDKLSEPRLIALGVLLSACSTGAMGLVDSYPALLVCSTMAGVGSAVFHPEGAKIVNRLAGTNKGKAMGTFAIGGSSGFAIGPIFAAAIAYNIGPSGLVAFTVFGLIWSIVLFFMMPRIVNHANTLQHSLAAKNDLPKRELTNNWKYFGLLFLVILAQSVNFRVMNAFIPIFWIRELGASPEQGSFALTVFFTIGIFTTYIGGILADRFGPARTVKWSLLLWLPAAIIFPHSTSMWMAFPAMFCVGVAKALGYSPVVVLGQSYLAKSIGFASGITFGLSMTIGGLVAPLVGKLADAYGLAHALNVLIPFRAIGAIVAFFLKEPEKEY